MKRIDILTTDLQLVDLARDLTRESAIAVDLEADSMHNYREKVCLIQVSTVQRTVLIDPLAVSNLTPLHPVLADTGIRKIFHAADYDLRCLKRDFNFSVRNLFDTMISAQLLGEERIGLADLLRKYFSVELDKKYQRADWSQRPLTADMIRYAAEDTSHLHSLMELFEARLKELGRMNWAIEEFALMEDVQFAENVGPLCLRFKGAATLPRRELGVLEKLLLWREEEGERVNRPVYKIIGNTPLLELARRKPKDKEALCGIEGLPPRLTDRYASALLSAVGEGLSLPEDELPRLPRPPRKVKDPGLEERIKVLKQWRQQAANDYALDPGVLINNAVLEAMAQINPRSQSDLERVSGLKKWQKQELGAGVLGALA